MPDTALTLLDYLQHVPDFRRREGKRYPLSLLLVLFILAIMSGHYGYREIARFLKANQQALVELLKLSWTSMPSHVTVRSVLMGLDFDGLNEAFRAWVAAHLRLEPGDWVGLDAKAIRSTVSHYDSPYQDFVCLVSAFTQAQGLVVASARYHNKATSEILVTRALIERLVETLGLRGVVFTLDALHCKKNCADDYRQRQRLPDQGQGQPTQAAACHRADRGPERGARLL